MSLELRGLQFQRGERSVLGPLDAGFRAGELVGVVGPNGSGKSTLLRMLYGYLRPTAGEVRLEGEAVLKMEPRRLSRLLGACPQEAEPTLDFTVDQALSLGLGGDTEAAWRRTSELAFLRLDELRGRQLSQLSGGEKQRIRVARALLAEPPWLVLDEPANHLDLATGWSLLEFLARPRAGGVVVALHDLTFATRFCHRLMVLRGGLLQAFAPPEQALTESLLAEVFGLAGRVVQRDGRPALQLDGVASR